MEEASEEIIDLRNRVLAAQQRNTVPMQENETLKKEYSMCANDLEAISKENASLKSQVQKLKYTIKNIAELL